MSTARRVTFVEFRSPNDGIVRVRPERVDAIVQRPTVGVVLITAHGAGFEVRGTVDQVQETVARGCVAAAMQPEIPTPPTRVDFTPPDTDPH